MQLKPLATTAIALMAMSTTAHAADLVYTPIIATAPQATSDIWTGFYLGVNGGFGQGQMVQNTVFGGYDAVNGVFAGLTAGYNVQLGSAVLGVEGDVQAAHMSQNVNGAVQTIRGFATLRARAGVLVTDAIMPYVTGGIAIANARNEMPTGRPATMPPDAERNHAGWTLGGGVEMKLTNAISVKAEYLHLNLGREVYYPAVGSSAPDIGINANIIRAGFNYRF